MDLLFADDCALVSHSMHELQAVVDNFSRACKSFGLTISTKKTEVIHQRPANSTDNTPCIITVDGVPLKVTDEFYYLGSTVNEKASLDDEIKLCIAKASGSFGKLQDRLWKSHDVRIQTKIKVYKATIVPILLTVLCCNLVFSFAFSILLRVILLPEYLSHKNDFTIGFDRRFFELFY